MCKVITVLMVCVPYLTSHSAEYAVTEKWFNDFALEIGIVIKPCNDEMAPQLELLVVVIFMIFRDFVRPP